MLLPTKHTKLGESILGLGSFVLGALTKPKTIDELWAEFQAVNNTDAFPAHHSFDNLVLALDFLFMTGVVAQEERGKFRREAR